MRYILLLSKWAQLNVQNFVRIFYSQRAEKRKRCSASVRLFGEVVGKKDHKIVRLIVSTYLFLCFGAFAPCKATTPPDYEQYFGADYTAAVNFCRENKHWFSAAAHYTDIKAELLAAILFPETLRYSLLSDLLETKALEYFYINNGSKSADFSIGNFQMKPSFAEQIEAEIAKNDCWSELFQPLLHYNHNNTADVRTERLARLQKIEWQLAYACALCRLVAQRFADTQEYAELGQLRFTAAAYNGGFNKTAAEIKKTAARRLFPYGVNAASEDQYVYCDISLDYYTRYAVPMFL